MNNYHYIVCKLVNGEFFFRLTCCFNSSLNWFWQVLSGFQPISPHDACCSGVQVHSRVHVLPYIAQLPLAPPPPLRAFDFSPLELSRQDVPHAAQNGLMFPGTFQVELEAADAAALVARLLGFCGHGGSCGGGERTGIHSVRRNWSSEREGRQRGAASSSLVTCAVTPPTTEAHSPLLHNSWKLNFASTDKRLQLCSTLRAAHWFQPQLVSQGSESELWESISTVCFWSISILWIESESSYVICNKLYFSIF